MTPPTIPAPTTADLARDAAADYEPLFYIEALAANAGFICQTVTPCWIRRAVAAEADAEHRDELLQECGRNLVAVMAEREALKTAIHTTESALAATRSRVKVLEAALRRVRQFSELGIGNDEAMHHDASDYIRVREIASAALAADATPRGGKE